jgi:hypothetical protein
MMTLTGTIKNGGAYTVKGKDGSEKVMISFNVADEVGNLYPCQMWPDDPQHQQLASQIASLRLHQVQLTVTGYTARMRKFKDGTEKPQANFVVSNVRVAAPAGSAASA